MALSTVTVERYRLGVQAWAGQSEPDKNRAFRLCATPGPRAKPQDGFFTSTWDSARRSSSWLDFMRTQGLRAPDGRRVWTLEPDPEATLYVIDTIGDYKLLADEYPQRWNHPNVSAKNPSYAPNWNRIESGNSKPFDGVHVTNAAIAAGKAQSPNEHPQFLGWDVESTLWLVWRFTGYHPVGVLGAGWELEQG